MGRIKGIEITDITIGDGAEATQESCVAANVRIFLRRGDEVASSPAFGPRVVIDLGRRQHIAGLLKGIPGMRVGGVREIVVSPHLAYGQAGIPGRIPPNALLRCVVELLEIRAHCAIVHEDYRPGRLLRVSSPHSDDWRYSGWSFEVHEDGKALLIFSPESIADTPEKRRYSEAAIILEATQSQALIEQAIQLPNQISGDCLSWGSESVINTGRSVFERETEKPCFVVHVQEQGEQVALYAAPEGRENFLNSTFYRSIEALIAPHMADASELNRE